MNNIYILIGIIIFLITFIKLFFNFLNFEKNKINKIIEFKNFLYSFYNVNNFKLIDILENEYKKIRYNPVLKNLIYELKIKLEKNEINNFSKVWDIFIDSAMRCVCSEFDNDLNVKENLKYYGKILCSYEEKNKTEIMDCIIKKMNDTILKLEAEFNKRKSLNFKYLIVSIILLIVLSV